ncbi:MAG TPA: N-acetyl-gamma-glutamyl-phosphate reductase [Capsulimonadaceae bacterium]|nr:N-acetyl-gamma-glutamyl-phosphate reductase [Capsulimonadaceae bacterium]
MVRAGIVGVSGYGGGELARLLLAHPEVELTYITSETYQGKPLSAALPGIGRKGDLVCKHFSEEGAIDNCDVVFLAAENGFAMHIAAGLVDAGKKVIDLSADFRLKDLQAYQQWYRLEHTAAGLLEKAVYGLPELYKKEIKSAQLVANPGCYPTAAILALAPLLDSKAVRPDTIVINSLSGVSGAGRSKHTLQYHFPELNESASAYGVAGAHRHTPEIEQALSQVAGEKVTVSFTPHLIPITRGILTTAIAELSGEAKLDDLRKRFVEFYTDAPFVIVVEPGQFPVTKQTFGTNYVYIGLAVDPRTNRVTVISAEDNLVKGAAGQAIQNMNLMCGFEETAGLEMGAVWP